MPFSRSAAALLALALTLFSFNAHAAVGDDLQALVADLGIINDDLGSVAIDSVEDCAQLGTLNTSVADYIDSLEMVYAQLSAPLALTPDDLTSLDQLSTLAADSADETRRLATELQGIEDVQDLFEYHAALAAMLRLSDDIGTMADRILEMADRILVMADNIGLMADRILATQQLQNANIALTQQAMLTTQENLIALSTSMSTIAYNTTLGTVVDDSQALADAMDAVTLTEHNMADELAALEGMTTALVDQATGLIGTVNEDSQVASHHINGDTLTRLGDLSWIHRALGDALEQYAAQIDHLAPVTDNAVLADATASMLRLTRDIGLMSNRIMQMSDRIIVMADNIGLMADRIVDTQNLQQSNLALTRNSLLTAQSATLAVIRDHSL